MSAAAPLPLVVLRVDGSARIGSGHVMRSLTLADALARRGMTCLFICRTLDDNLAARITRSGHVLACLPADGPQPDAQHPYGDWLGTTQAHDAAATACLVPQPPLLVVVDHYGLDADWERHLGAHLDAPILAIDDLGRHHAAALLLDTTFSKPDDAYAGLIPNGARALVGARYALLRPDFAQGRDAALLRRDADMAAARPARDILIAMGGGDEHDATGWLVDGLAPLAERHDLLLHVLVGAAYPHGDALAARAVGLGARLVQHRDVWDMAALLARIDLCIGAAGSSAWERCCLGLPAINLVLADNQRTIAAALSHAGAAVNGGVFDPATDPIAWADWHVVPCLPAAARVPISQAARQVTDGRGVALVLAATLADRVRAMPLTLRPAQADDAALLYEWQCDPRTRRFAVTAGIPTWPEHIAWLTRKLADPAATFYIATAGGIACGVLRLDPSSAAQPPRVGPVGWREISILTAPEFYSCGVAGRALKTLQASHAGETLVARVLPGNVPSQRLFAAARFVPYAPQMLVWASALERGPNNGTAV